MKKAVLLLLVALLVLTTVQAGALTEAADYDLIVIVNHGERIDKKDDPERVRFEWLRLLAEEACAPGAQAALLGVPMDEKAPYASYKLENEAGVKRLCEDAEALPAENYSSWEVAIEPLKKAKELWERGDQNAVVVFVHSGTIDFAEDVAKESRLAEWIASLGNRFIAIETHAQSESVFANAELPAITELRLGDGGASLLAALALDDIHGAVQTLIGTAMTLPSADDADKAAEAEAAEEGMGWTFDLSADGVTRLMLLADAEAPVEELGLRDAAGKACQLKAECTQLGGKLLIVCETEEPLEAGSWTLSALAGVLGEEISLLPCWHGLSAELTVSETLEYGERLSGQLAFKAGDQALDTGALLEAANLTLKVEIATGETLRTCPITPDEQGQWMYNMTLEPGEHTLTARLYDAQGSVMNALTPQSVQVTSENAAPTAVKDVETEYEIRYNDGEEAQSFEWNLSELFSDTPGDLLYYTVEAEPAESALKIERKGNQLSVSLAKQEEETCRLTLTAVDHCGEEAQLEWTIESVDYGRLQKEIYFDLAVTETELKGETVDITLTAHIPQAMDAAFAKALLNCVQPVLTVNGEDCLLTREGERWTASFVTGRTAQTYDIEAKVLLDKKMITVEPGSVRFETINRAPLSSLSEMDYALTVEPFLRAHGYVAGEVLTPKDWFSDEDGDELTITACVVGHGIALSGSTLNLGEGEKLTAAVTGSVSLAALSAGEYDVLFTARDADGATAEVKVHVKARSQTVMALVIIAILVVLAAAVAVLLVIRYKHKPSLGLWKAQIKVLQPGTFGELDARNVHFEKNDKSMVTLLEIFRKTGLPRVKGLSVKALKSVTLTPERTGVRVSSRLEDGYSLKIGGKVVTEAGELLSGRTVITLENKKDALLEVTWRSVKDGK